MYRYFFFLDPPRGPRKEQVRKGDASDRPKRNAKFERTEIKVVDFGKIQSKILIFVKLNMVDSDTWANRTQQQMPWP